MSAGPNASPPSPASAPSAQGPADGGGRWRPGRRVAASLAAVLLLAATALALLQPLHPNPLRPRTGLADWLYYPTETNAWWRLPEIRANLTALDVVTGPGGEDLLWAVGNQGAILHSRDGGRCWEWQGPWRPAAAARVCAPGRLWDAVRLLPQAAAAEAPTRKAADPGTGYGTGPARPGQTAAAPAGVRETLRKAGPGGMVQEQPYVQEQSQGTASPEPKAAAPVPETASPKPPSPPDLSAVDFVDAGHGWAVGADGAILATNDGGATWVAQAAPAETPLYAVRFLDAKLGWAAGIRGTLLRTRDGGATWTAQTSGIYTDLLALGFADAQTGWALGYGGTILKTADGGATWETQASGTDSRLTALHVIDGRTLWAVGYSGTLLKTSDGGATWKTQASGVSAALRSVHFRTPLAGWATGADGTLLRTLDGGQTWAVSPSGVGADLKVIHFADSGAGWAITKDGTVLRSSDAGASWTHLALGPGRTLGKPNDDDQHSPSPLAPNRIGPAPWYWASLLVCLGLLGYAASPERPRVVGQSVADLFASDRPLRSRWETDALGLGTIADSLSEFLRNRATEAPLTVAIVGDWGSGKTSLMNLLRADLERNRFQPVWFNAWHHQKGEQILASLFAHVREQSIPPLLSWRGLAFRGRLLVRRGAPLWLLVALLAVVLSASLAYLGDSIADYSARVLAVIRDPERIWSVDWRPLTAFFSAVAGLGGSLFGLWKAMQGFGLDPRRLVTVNPEGGKGPGLDPGARARFARELRDVTECLKPRKMTIFIDDLDRCQQQGLIEVLEAVSFLASSGDCFIVLGMSERWVEACVGLEYEKLAQAMSDQAQNGSPPEELRRRFARNYLEKLVNLAVPVPDLERRRAELLVDGPARRIGTDAAGEADAPAHPGWGRRLVAGVDGFWQPVILVGAVVYGVWFGADLLHKPPAAVPAPPAPLWTSSELRLTPAQSGAQGAASPPAGTSAANAAPATTPAATPRTLTELLGVEIGLRADPKALADGVVVAEHGGVQVLLRRPVAQASPAVAPGPAPAPAAQTRADQRPAEDDGTAPTGLFAGQPPEPRIPVSLWLTGLGFLGLWAYRSARRARHEITQDSPEFRTALKTWLPLPLARQDTPRAIKRFINRLRYIAIRLRKTGGAEFPEPNTVALAALHLYDPARLGQRGFWSAAPDGGPALDAVPAAADADETLLRECVEAHRQFAQAHALPWPPTDAHRAAFLAVLSERSAAPRTGNGAGPALPTT